MAPQFSLDGRTAIVTGASFGLGVAMARALGEAGANVVLAARTKEKLEETADALDKDGIATLIQPCDIADSGDVRNLVEAAADRFGRVDVMVNNAGQAAEAGCMPERVPDELFLQTVNTNLVGTFWCCREAGAKMLADGKGGSIINIASIAGMGGQPNFPPAYQATKAAVVNLTRNLACSWADRGVRVNCIAPGWFPSEMTAGWFSIPAFLQRFQDAAPMRRVGDPGELAGPLVFLASDASSFVTGQVLPVDGGLSASLGAMPYTDELFDLQAQVVPTLGERILPS
jgi:NAD(P)-dependent dehydrogenase (short-subunit alcohol dehydrogenase family)